MSESVQSWNSYWQGTRDVGAYGIGGVSHPAIEAFWNDLFASVRAETPAPAMLDVGTGNGALIEMAHAVFDEAATLSCVDVSTAAIESIKSRMPGVEAIVSDAKELALPGREFDLVTSQFGVEYAGVEAVGASAALVKDGGLLVLMIHHNSSSIHAECANNLAAVERLKVSGFIPRAIEMFRAGFAAVRGADRAPYEAAARALQPSVNAVEKTMAELGEDAAGGTLAQLYADVARLHGNIQRYDESEVLGWLERMDSELDGYQGRMKSMLSAAVDQSTLDKLCEELAAKGFTISIADPLFAEGSDVPLAWILVARHGEEPVTGIGTGTGIDRERLDEWINSSIVAATHELAEAGSIGSFAEAKPAWVYPFKILLGKVRNPGDGGQFKWFTYGDVKTDLLDRSVAFTPKDAVRHFSLKWQADAESAPPEDRQKLIDDAELLYELSDADDLWL